MLSNSGLPRASAPSKRGRHDRCRSSAFLSLGERPHLEALIPGDGPPQRQEPAGAAGGCAERDGVVTIDGRRRKITKREANVAPVVDKSASADLRATKMLIDLMKGIEQQA